ncbi:MAG TPA: MarR family transcriptional regulator [Solimonas sp.]
MKPSEALSDGDYRTLADFRHAIRRFLAFSEDEAAAHGMTPQQHQALLIIRAAGNDGATVGLIAERLILKPHSATGLVGRLEALGLLKRLESAQDRRRAILKLTPRARRQLAALTAIHRQELKRLRPVLGTIMAQLDQALR